MSRNDGRNAVLKDYVARGDLKFHQAELERAFWEKSGDERISDVTLAPERVAEHFSQPPWAHFRRVLAEDATFS